MIGIPSNDFGKQEPGTAKEIRDFCDTKYKVTFPLLEKQQTKEGEGQSPIYANLKKQSNELPNWNFCKYLVGKDGKVIKFYASKVKPDDADLRKAIDEALAK
ncbi:phospholipid-hydroperoxide glutathione peroxidase [Planctomycetaceae bacterium]|nr:phospholipid-hydroperoxide glutathione peroxidase [Planctomycetaceae bacterium]